MTLPSALKKGQGRQESLYVLLFVPSSGQALRTKHTARAALAQLDLLLSEALSVFSIHPLGKGNPRGALRHSTAP